MTASTDQQLQLQILSQLGELGQQIGTLQAQSAHIITEQAKSAESRREVYEKLGLLSVVAAEVRRIVPLVDSHEKIHQRAAGAAWLGKTLWATGAGGIGAAATMLLQKLTGGGTH